MSVLKRTWSLKKLDPYARWRLMSIFLLALLVSLVIGSYYFIYSYIYRTLDDVRTIVVLNSSYSINNVNMETYKKSMRALNTKKTVQTIPRNLRNIFTSSVPTVSTTTTATSTKQ